MRSNFFCTLVQICVLVFRVSALVKLSFTDLAVDFVLQFICWPVSHVQILTELRDTVFNYFTLF